MCWKSGVAGVGGWVSGWVEHLERIREEGGDGQSHVQQEEEQMRVEKKNRQEELRKGNGSVSSLEHKDAAREKTLVTWIAGTRCRSKNTSKEKV